MDSDSHIRYHYHISSLNYRCQNLHIPHGIIFCDIDDFCKEYVIPRTTIYLSEIMTILVCFHLTSSWTTPTICFFGSELWLNPCMIFSRMCVKSSIPDIALSLGLLSMLFPSLLPIFSDDKAFSWHFSSGIVVSALLNFFLLNSRFVIYKSQKNHHSMNCFIERWLCYKNMGW